MSTNRTQQKGTFIVGRCNFVDHGLIIVAALGYLPLSLGRAVVVGFCCQAAFVVPTLPPPTGLDPFVFLVQNMYLCTITFFLCLACHLNHKMRCREFDLLTRLHQGRAPLQTYGD